MALVKEFGCYDHLSSERNNCKFETNNLQTLEKHRQSCPKYSGKKPKEPVEKLFKVSQVISKNCVTLDEWRVQFIRELRKAFIQCPRYLDDLICSFVGPQFLLVTKNLPGPIKKNGVYIKMIHGTTAYYYADPLQKMSKICNIMDNGTVTEFYVGYRFYDEACFFDSIQRLFINVELDNFFRFYTLNGELKDSTLNILYDTTIFSSFFADGVFYALRYRNIAAVKIIGKKIGLPLIINNCIHHSCIWADYISVDQNCNIYLSGGNSLCFLENNNSVFREILLEHPFDLESIKFFFFFRVPEGYIYLGTNQGIYRVQLVIYKSENKGRIIIDIESPDKRVYESMSYCKGILMAAHPHENYITQFTL